MKKGLVSIIVPVYNSENYINRCLDSLLTQTYNQIEIVLIDDGSRDESVNLIKEYSKLDKRVKLYCQPNQGPSVARNAGINKARGEYIMFVDADDYIDKCMVREMLENIDENKNTLVICDNSEIWTNEIYEVRVFEDRIVNLTKRDVIKSVVSGRCGLVCGKLFNKNLIDTYNIRFDENIKMCEDQIFFLCVCKCCEKFIYVPKLLYFYDRRNESSITMKYQENAIDNQIYVLKKIEKLLEMSDLDKKSIKILLDQRYLNAINFCISNEVMNTNKANFKSKINNVKNITGKNNLKEVIEKIDCDNRRDRIIVKAFSKNSYLLIFSKFYLLERIISPIKVSLEKVIKR